MQSEARIQQDAFTEIRNRHPATYGCLWHVPNGGIRDAITATFMRGAGVVKGIADLFFLWAGKVYIIEVKTPTGTCSNDQKLIHAIHAGQGFDTYLFTSSDDIIRFVEMVITGGDIGEWSAFISPFSRPEMISVYRDLVREERKRKLQKVA